MHIRKTIKKKPLEYKRAALIKELIKIYLIHNSKNNLKFIMRSASGIKKNYNSKKLRAITRHKRRRQTRHKRKRKTT